MPLRELPPVSYRRRHDPPVLEVTADDGTVIGWIETRRLTGGSTFYFATGVHPETGAKINLQGSTDLDERVRVLEAFHADPQSSAQHLPRPYVPHDGPGYWNFGAGKSGRHG